MKKKAINAKPIKKDSNEYTTKQLEQIKEVLYLDSINYDLQSIVY